jgi:hypothetical protein
VSSCICEGELVVQAVDHIILDLHGEIHNCQTHLMLRHGCHYICIKFKHRIIGVGLC